MNKQKSNLLINSGLKQTKARQELLNIFALENRPLNVSEIISKLNKQKISVDQATIYRNLELFLEKKLIIRIEFQEGKFRFELSGNEHHHLICENCGKIENYNKCLIEELKNDIINNKSFSVKRHSLEFYGLCKNCLIN